MTAHSSGPLLDSGAEGAVRGLFENFPLSHDPDYIRLWDDFLGLAVDGTTMWEVVKDGSATVAYDADEIGGLMLITSQGTTENDGGSIQGDANFMPDTAKDTWFEARVKVSDADQCDMYVGLTVPFTTNPEAVLTAADLIGFYVNDASASIYSTTEISGTPTAKDTEVDIGDGVFIKLGFHITGEEKVEFYVNRVLVSTHTTNIPDDVNMTPAFMHISGNATGTHVASIDYIMCVQKR